MRSAVVRGGFGPRIGAGKRVGCGIRDRGHRRVRRLQHVWERAGGIPSNQRIDRRRQRVEISADPAEALRVRGIGGRPDIGAQKVRATLILVAGPLHERKAAVVENLFQPGKARMQSQRHARRVGADLQHLTRGDGERRPPAVVERIVVGHEHTERIVSAAQVQDDEIACVRALRPREIAEKLRRRERHRERSHAAFDELSSRDFHMSWYSGDPAMR